MLSEFATPFIAVLVPCAAFAALLTFIAMKYATRARILDVPNGRSSHAMPMPRGGGIAIAAVFYAWLLVAMYRGDIERGVAVALLAGAPVLIVGWIDDCRGASVISRATVHVLSGVAAMIALGGFNLPGLVTNVWTAPVSMVAGVLLIAWSTNLFNFMDGIDGIAGAEGATVSLGMAALILVGAALGGRAADVADASAVQPFCALAGGCIGFLVWNRPPARVFMGDSGSGFIGFTLAVLAIQAHNSLGVHLTLSLTVFGVFVFDATLTLLRRIVSGEVWYHAHHSHAYQRAVEAGATHGKIVLAVLLLNVSLLFIAMLDQADIIPAWWSCTAALGVLVVAYRQVGKRVPMVQARQRRLSPIFARLL